MDMSEPFPIFYDTNLYKMVLKWIDNMNYKIIVLKDTKESLFQMDMLPATPWIESMTT